MSTRTLATIAAKSVIGGGILLTLAGLPSSCAHVHAMPDEDSPEWSCVDMGNRVCGPGNSNGAPAGCYDDGGVLFAAWPCAPWVPSDGYRHGNGTISYP